MFKFKSRARSSYNPPLAVPSYLDPLVLLLKISIGLEPVEDSCRPNETSRRQNTESLSIVAVLLVLEDLGDCDWWVLKRVGQRG